MTQKTYKTARGKTVDLGALQMQNENTRAVGNMNVNARGDRIDPRGVVVDSRNSRTARTYNDQVSNVKSAPVPASRKKVEADVPVASAPAAVVDDPMVDNFLDVAAPAKPQMGGLAAAMAASRAVKQEQLKTPRQESRSRNGVQKI